MSHDQQLTSGNGTLPQSIPNPEVKPRAKRRTFSAEYKMRILAEAAACTHPSERGALHRREQRTEQLDAVITRVSPVTCRAACAAVGLARSTFYRLQQPVSLTLQARPKAPSPRALSVSEQANVLSLLNSERFQDHAPRE